MRTQEELEQELRREPLLKKAVFPKPPNWSKSKLQEPHEKFSSVFLYIEDGDGSLAKLLTDQGLHMWSRWLRPQYFKEKINLTQCERCWAYVITHDYHDHFKLFFSYLFYSFSLLTYLRTHTFVYFFLLIILRLTNEQPSTMDSRYHLRHASTTGLGYRQSRSSPRHLLPSPHLSPHPTLGYLQSRDHRTSTRPHPCTEPYDEVPI